MDDSAHRLDDYRSPKHRLGVTHCYFVLRPEIPWAFLRKYQYLPGIYGGRFKLDFTHVQFIGACFARCQRFSISFVMVSIRPLSLHEQSARISTELSLEVVILIAYYIARTFALIFQIWILLLLLRIGQISSSDGLA